MKVESLTNYLVGAIFFSIYKKEEPIIEAIFQKFYTNGRLDQEDPP